MRAAQAFEPQQRVEIVDEQAQGHPSVADGGRLEYSCRQRVDGDRPLLLEAVGDGVQAFCRGPLERVVIARRRGGRVEPAQAGEQRAVAGGAGQQARALAMPIGVDFAALAREQTRLAVGGIGQDGELAQRRAARRVGGVAIGRGADSATSASARLRNCSAAAARKRKVARDRRSSRETSMAAATPMPISRARSSATWPAEWPGMLPLVTTMRALIGALRSAGDRPAAKARRVTSTSGAIWAPASTWRSRVPANPRAVPSSAPRTRSQPALKVEPVSGRTTMSALITAQNPSGSRSNAEAAKARSTAAARRAP